MPYFHRISNYHYWNRLTGLRHTCGMAIRGQRFHIDLDNDQSTHTTTRSLWSLVTDIQERSASTDAKPPTPPRIKSSQSGFPAHKKPSQPSVFRQRSGQTSNHGANPKTQPSRIDGPEVTSQGQMVQELDERHKIDIENRQRIANMSSEDIDQARKELMSGLSGSLIERLLKKADIDDQPSEMEKHEHHSQKKPSNKNVTFEAKVTGSETAHSQAEDDAFNPDPEDAPPKPPDMRPVSSFSGYPATPSFHFPQPPTPPSIDPEDPDFLTKLHSTYFPSLPANPGALSWMQAPDPAENEAYSPTRDSLPPSAVRFDFRGRLLPPRLAAQIPTTKGLHHHGTAPEAAGYTIPELAHLSRSSFPSQRCIAYQTLGRVLYRLGTGVFGPEDYELCQGLWKCIEQGRILDTLTAEAARDGESGNRSCWVTATEAVWLWRKGGGRKWKAT